MGNTYVCRVIILRQKFEFLVLCVGSKALGSHTTGSHSSVGQMGGVLDPRNKPLHTSLCGATPPTTVPVDVNRSVLLILLNFSWLLVITVCCK